MRTVVAMQPVDATVCHFKLSCGHTIVAAGQSADDLIWAMNENRPVRCWKCPDVAGRQ